MNLTAKTLLLVGIISCSYLSFIEATKEEGKNANSVTDKFKRKLSRTISGKYFEKEYAKISEYLEGHSEPEDSDTNMRIAENWLKSDKEICTFLRNALEQFTELSKVLGEDSCSEKSYNILSTNDAAVQSRSREIRVGKDPKFERVDKVVRQFCMRHSKKCMKIYPKNYEKLLTRLSRVDIKRLEKFTDGIIDSRMAQSKRQGDAMKIYGDIVSPFKQVHLKGGDGVEAVYRAIKELSEDDEESDNSKDSKKGTLKRKIKTQFEKYIRAPCKVYNEVLGKDLFTPATFDTIYFHKVDDNAVEFYKGWARFKICGEILGEQGSSLIEDVIEVAKQR